MRGVNRNRYQRSVSSSYRRPCKQHCLRDSSRSHKFWVQSQQHELPFLSLPLSVVRNAQEASEANVKHWYGEKLIAHLRSNEEHSILTYKCLKPWNRRDQIRRKAESVQIRCKRCLDTMRDPVYKCRRPAVAPRTSRLRNSGNSSRQAFVTAGRVWTQSSIFWNWG